MAFRPLDGPWGYAHDAIEHVEEWNCSRGHGCQHGARKGSPEWRKIGPGASCSVLLAIVTDPDKPIEALDFDGGAEHATCWQYEPRPEPPPRKPAPIAGPGQLAIE